jgi:hypothetical protein
MTVIKYIFNNFSEIMIAGELSNVFYDSGEDI